MNPPDPVTPTARSPCPAGGVAVLLLVAVAAGPLPALAQGSPPAPDTSHHAVPLDSIFFDNFGSEPRLLPLTEISADRRRQLIDAIRPIHGPAYTSADAAGWLSEGDRVVGYEGDGAAWAFPVRVLNVHEIVNDSLAGEPVLVTYCPLCGSGVVYRRRAGGRLLTFGNTSALYQSDMVMVDYATGSYWWQVTGKAIVGELTGRRLPVLPSLTTTWGRWRSLHPDTRVLARPAERADVYGGDRFEGYRERVDRGRFAFPVSRSGAGAGLGPGAPVLAVEAGDSTLAVPLERDADAVVRDTLGGVPVAVLVDAESRSGAAFRPEARGRSLTLTVEDGAFVDRETGSEWDLTGRAVAGPMEGERLPRLPTRHAMWFALAADRGRLRLEGGG